MRKLLIQIVVLVTVVALAPAPNLAQKKPVKRTPAAGAKSAAGAKGNPVVTMQTSMGTIVLELYPEKAPVTVKNFLSYVDSGFYNGTIFHRVIPTFMIQGGGFTSAMTKKPTKSSIKNEAANGLGNERGTIAMARTSDVNSATAQFFINVRDNQSLNHRSNSPDEFGYAVFGKVISGIAVVDAIKSVKTTSKGGYENVPVQPVIIKSVKRR